MNYEVDNINGNSASGSGNNNGMFNLIYNNMYKVYDVLVKIVQSNPNFTFASEEKAVHTVHVFVGKSLFSKGDPLSITLEEIDENKTKMYCAPEYQNGSENFRSKYGTLIQKLLDKINSLLPPVIEHEAPKPNNLVQVGELSRQMGMVQGNDRMKKDEPTSLNSLMSNNNANGGVTTTSDSSPIATDEYKNAPKPFEYASLKENESSKHAGNDPLLDLMKNI